MSTPVTSALQRAIGDAQHALDSHQLSRWLRGSGHLSGGPATADIGLTVEVPGDAEVLLDGETVAVDEFNSTADVTPDDDRPRWSIISVQSDGSVTATDGEPRTLVGDADQPARVRNPAPPLEYPGVCYAAVFVPAGAAEVTDDELLDRRLGASIRLGSLLADEIDIDEATVSNLVAEAATIDGNDSPYAQDPHELGSTQHDADTLANLNSKVSDATLDDTGDPREPEAHSGTHENGGTDEMSVAGLSGELADPQPSQTQDDGTNVVASSTLNFGTALDVTDNAGTAEIDFDTQFAENTPDWIRDGQKTVTNETDISYTLSDSYLFVDVFIFANIDTTSNVDFDLQVNNDTGDNYDYDASSGTTITDSSAFGIAQDFSGGSSTGEKAISLRFDGEFSERLRVNNLGPVSASRSVMTRGHNESVTSPLNELRVFSSQGETFDEISVTVFGLNL